MTFETISNITMDELSWKNKIFLTMDIDWACDGVFSSILDMIEENNLKVTLFITHNTSLSQRARVNPNIELGIHPNFNPLLLGDFIYGKNAEEVIQYYLNIVPEAKSVRSHSLTQNSHILNLFTKYNLKFDSNHFIPLQFGINVKPWKNWDNNLIKIPFIWEDDLHCVYDLDWDINLITNYEGLKVLAFHPTNLFLNTHIIEHYENAKKCFHDFECLKELVNKKEYGELNFFKDLIKKVKNG
mgnify:CR=1 FL=1